MNLTVIDRARLRLSGWRKCDEKLVAHFGEALIESGFEVHETALAFLRSFGGLRFRSLVRGNDFHFDPRRIMRRPNASYWVSAYGTFIGDTLCPIGEADGENFLLTIGSSGVFLGGYDDLLLKFGDSGVEGVSTLLNGKRGLDLKFVR